MYRVYIQWYIQSSLIIVTYGTGATFMRDSYVAELRLLAWLRERTVLVKSEHELSPPLVANIKRIS